MSFSSNLKDTLSLITIKNACCKQNFENGMTYKEFSGKCENCAGAYLRGLFISCGTVTDIEKQNMVSFNRKGCCLAATALDFLGIPYSVSKSPSDRCYIRENDGIADFFAAVGAGNLSMKFTEMGIIREVKKANNRLNNAELSNINKTAVSSADVRKAINTIKKHKDFQKLPEDLTETATIRLENPDMSLDEMRKLHSKPISKSGLYHRLAKIKEFAEKYKK